MFLVARFLNKALGGLGKALDKDSINSMLFFVLMLTLTVNTDIICS
jgi:hypothetical protein